MTGPVSGWRRGAALVPLAALLLPATLAAQDPGQIALLPGRTGVDPEPGSLLATPARLTVNGLPLAEALSRLSERSHVRIAFSPTLLPEDHRVECDCASLNTARALDQLLAGTGLGYVELGTQIVVVPLAPAEPPPANGTIRGRIRTEVAFPPEDVLLVESDLGDGKFGVDAGVALLTARVSVAGGLPEDAREKFGLASVRWRIGARRSHADALTKSFLSAPFPFYFQVRQAGFEVWTKG